MKNNAVKPKPQATTETKSLAGPVEKVIGWCCRLLRMSRQSFIELFLYVLFGGLTTVINFIVDFPLRFAGVDKFISIPVAWVVSVLFALVTNKIWVFQSKDYRLRTWFKEGIPFVAARLMSLGLEYLITYLLVDLLLADQLFVKILSAIVVIVFNYVASKLVIFRKSKKAD